MNRPLSHTQGKVICMIKKTLLLFLICVTACVFSSCVKLTEANKAEKQITATITYKEVATESDFQRYNNAYSDPPREVPLEKDGYYLVKFECLIDNESSNDVSMINLIPVSNEWISYEADAVDIEATMPISSYTSEARDVYLYINKSLDTEEKTNEQLNNMTFEFEAQLFNENNKFISSVLFKGEYKASP